MKPSTRSDFLFARPAFMAGVARLFDFYGTYNSYNLSDSEEEADDRATFSDWRLIGIDIINAMESFNNTTAK
jgi:hypothetical protein